MMSHKIGNVDPKNGEATNQIPVAPQDEQSKPQKKIPFSAPASSQNITTNPASRFRCERMQLPPIVELAINSRNSKSQPPTARNTLTHFLPPIFQPNLYNLRQRILTLEGKEKKITEDFLILSNFFKEIDFFVRQEESRKNMFYNAEDLKSIAEKLTQFKSLESLLTRFNCSSPTLSAVYQILLFNYQEISDLVTNSYNLIEDLLKRDFFNEYEVKELIATKEKLEKTQETLLGLYITLKNIEQSSQILTAETFFHRIITQLLNIKALTFGLEKTFDNLIIAYYLNYSPTKAQEQAEAQAKTKRPQLPKIISKHKPQQLPMIDVRDIQQQPPVPSSSGLRGDAINREVSEDFEAHFDLLRQQHNNLFV